MIKRQISCIITALLFASTTCAQSTINTDRPDQSDGVATVPDNHWQIENGVTLANGILTNNLMLRYGVTSSTEVRVLADVGKVFKNEGFQPLTFSLKQKLMEEQKLFPAITFVGYVSYAELASKDFQAREVPFTLTLAFENTLSDKMNLGYNIGTSERMKNLNFSIGTSYSPLSDFSLFIEYFAVFADEARPEHNIDAGLLYLIKPNLQVDFAAGHYIDNDNDGVDERFFSTFGISYLFNKR